MGTTILEKQIASIFRAENASYIRKTEAVVSFKTLVTISHTIHRHIVEDRNLVLIYQLRIKRTFLSNCKMGSEIYR